jgi:uncharacterized protein involved in exopolysaccharide biosynthesis
VEIEGDTDVDAQLLATLEQRYQEAQNTRRAAEVRESVNQVTGDELATSPLIEELKAKLAAERAELAQMRTTLGSQHPRMIEQRSQIAATQDAISREQAALSKGNVADLSQARQLEEKFAAATTEQRRKLIDIRGNQAEGAKLLLELESARSVYKRALDGYDQIKAAAGGKYSNVSLLAEATVPVKATRPNKLRLLALAAFLSLGAGFAGPFLYELMFNRRVRCADDVERDLGIPVLVEFDPGAAPATIP